MKRKAPVIRQDELAAAIEEARKDFGRTEEVRPSGALSLYEWAEKLGLGRTVMGEKMREAVIAGTYERLIVRSKDASGRTYPQPLYRKVKNAVDRIR